MQIEVARRRVLDLRDPAALAAFIERHPDAATAELTNWRDHPLGASPLGYVAMARFDTARGVWRDVDGTAAIAHQLIAAGAPVDGADGDSETPLITAASYGDAAVAAVLIAAGADIDALAAPDAGGVPGGSALLHAAVFGMTDVTRRARRRRGTGAFARGGRGRRRDRRLVDRRRRRADSRQGTGDGRSPRAPHGARRARCPPALRSTPRTPCSAATRCASLRPEGRPASVRRLLGLGADPGHSDADGLTPLDLARRGRGGRARSGALRRGRDVARSDVHVAGESGRQDRGQRVERLRVDRPAVPVPLRDVAALLDQDGSLLGGLDAPSATTFNPRHFAIDNTAPTSPARPGSAVASWTNVWSIFRVSSGKRVR